MHQNHLSSGNIPHELADNLVQLNPHWVGRPGPLTPRFRRWVFKRLWRLLTSGLTPATVLRGPRRVGKTVLLRQLMENLLAEGVSGENRVQCALWAARDPGGRRQRSRSADCSDVVVVCDVAAVVGHLA